MNVPSEPTSISWNGIVVFFQREDHVTHMSEIPGLTRFQKVIGYYRALKAMNPLPSTNFWVVLQFHRWHC